MHVTLGHLLGAPQAEADQSMLQLAFIETPDYQSLLHTTDYYYVVGRRGTGKSAIYQRLKKEFSSDSGIILIAEEPEDYEMLEFQALLATLGSDYRLLRAICRQLWTLRFLVQAGMIVSNHYKFKKSKQASFLSQYINQYRGFSERTGPGLYLDTLRNCIKDGVSAQEIPRAIVDRYQIRMVSEALQETLRETELRIVALYDRLDEAWAPDIPSISILGGLARAASDSRDKRFPLYPILFIRDNMFRALAQFDDDFTRYIEGHSLRLHWDEESLFHLVSARLRVALHEQRLESELKVWNRFAQRELQSRAGFAKCLRYTLYRPRDILVLLNEAYTNARRDNRDAIIESDVEKSAVTISQHRLEDLCKEYDKVLPGLRLFVSAFRGQPAQQKFTEVVALLDNTAAQNDYSEEGSKDLAIFADGGEMFSALYSVGFIGLRNETAGPYTFCHDGTMSALVSIEANRATLVHPCYWKALDIAVAIEEESVALHTNDEYEVPRSDEPKKLRLRRLGRLPEELSGIVLGLPGSREFEAWVLRAVRVLFSGPLMNIELKPNPATSLNQRDVVATNAATSTFWRRVYEDYHSRQIIFECKNYEELKTDDFRQVLDYGTSEYGAFAIVVRRGKTENLVESEKNRIRALFFEHKTFIMVLPVSLLALCIRKHRTPKRYDYTEFVMSRHMDYIVRSVLSLTHAPKYKIKRRK